MIGLAVLMPPQFYAYSQNSENNDYAELVRKARKAGWMKLSMSELMKNIAMEFIGIPYVGGTLDESDSETCSVFLDKLDCVTFFETVLGIAKCFREGKFDFDDLVGQVRSTRYRNGLVVDYTSRLHYTADWIYSNSLNGTVEDITKKLGGQKIHFQTGFMSSNPDKYKSLAANPGYVPIIKQQEIAINNRDYYYIPKEKLNKVITGIQTCDIIALTTSIKGLDYSHVGFAYKNDDGEIQFMHASSARKKVVLDTYLSDYIKAKSKDTGITVLRVL